MGAGRTPFSSLEWKSWRLRIFAVTETNQTLSKCFLDTNHDELLDLQAAARVPMMMVDLLR